MKKTFEELLGKGSKVGGELMYPKNYILKLMKEIRESTIKECIERGYGLYYESVFDRNPTYVDIEDKSLEKLDKTSIEIYKK